MTTDAELITLSFEIAAERCDDLTPVVYRRLFSDHPEMERLFFRDAQTHAVRGEMLARVTAVFFAMTNEWRSAFYTPISNFPVDFEDYWSYLRGF